LSPSSYDAYAPCSVSTPQRLLHTDPLPRPRDGRVGPCRRRRAGRRCDPVAASGRPGGGPAAHRRDPPPAPRRGRLEGSAAPDHGRLGLVLVRLHVRLLRRPVPPGRPAAGRRAGGGDER
jgi:hypothetical protein